MNYDKKRLEIFNTYSENFLACSNIFDIQVGKIQGGKINIEKEFFYICPTCKGIHDENSLDLNFPNHLSLEHVPPKSMGGKATILTCKKCNNTSGSDLDIHLTRNLNIKRLTDGSGIPIDSILDLGFAKFKVDLKFDKQKTTWNFQHRNNPFLESKLSELQNSWDGLKFNVNISGGNPDRIILAHVRIAYLKLFEILGYPYIFTPSGQFIIKQIHSKKEVKNNTLVFKDPRISDKEGIHLVSDSNKNWFGVLVVYNLLDKKSGIREHFGVVLPGPFVENLEHFQNIQKTTIDINLKKLPMMNYLEEPKHIFNLFHSLNQNV
ncbi:HNH endonuclease [Ekhidna sp.]|uniref:HNH endonuclease n=1 Tax=Ekhidna sp. TaxID=2608089 RepID=UPI003BA84BC1